MEGNGLFQLLFPCHSLSLLEVMEGIQYWSPQVETQVEIMEECYILACFPWIVQFTFLNQDHLFKESTAHNGQDFHASIIHEKKHHILTCRTI